MSSTKKSIESCARQVFKLHVTCALAAVFILLISCNKNNDTPSNPGSGTPGIWTNTHFPFPTADGIFSMLATKGGRILVGVKILYGNPSMYYSTDTGYSWHSSDSLNHARINGNVYVIKQNPITGRIFVGCSAQQLNSLFTSTDDGATWVNNPNTFFPCDFAFMNNKTYMCILNGVAPNPPEYLLSSTDEFASNWTNCSPNTAFAPYTLFADNGALFVGAIGSNGLYKTSVPENRTYTPTDNGIAWANAGTSWMTRMTREGTYLFTATTDGVFRSADNGATWSACNLGFKKGANDFAVVGSDVYVALTDSAVYKSSDNGATWSSFNKGLTLPLTVRCLQVLNNYLLEGDVNSQVYKIKLN